MKRTGLMILVLGLSFSAQMAQADWSAAKRLTWTFGDSGFPAIALDSSDAIHVVWIDDTPGNFETFYRKSLDGGTTWGAAVRLTWTLSTTDYSPAIAIDSSDAIHVVWDDHTPGGADIYYKRSLDGGATWSTGKKLAWTSGNCRNPAMAIDSSDTIHIVYYDDTPGNLELYYTRSEDGGATWSAAQRITWASGDSYNPAIAIDSGDTIHVVWHDFRSGDPKVYYMKSADGGMTWSAAKRLAWTLGNSYDPVLDIDPFDAVQVAWVDYTPGNGEIYCRRSEDGGATWNAAQRITWTLDKSSQPVVAIGSSGTINVAWEESKAGNVDIYYKGSDNGGATWSAAQRITWTSGESRFVAAAGDSMDIGYIVWHDNTSGNYEIYFKKNT